MDSRQAALMQAQKHRPFGGESARQRKALPQKFSPRVLRLVVFTGDPGLLEPLPKISSVIRNVCCKRSG